MQDIVALGITALAGAYLLAQFVPRASQGKVSSCGGQCGAACKRKGAPLGIEERTIVALSPADESKAA